MKEEKEEKTLLRTSYPPKQVSGSLIGVAVRAPMVVGVETRRVWDSVDQ